MSGCRLERKPKERNVPDPCRSWKDVGGDQENNENAMRVMSTKMKVNVRRKEAGLIIQHYP